MEKADILEMTVAYLRTVYRCVPPTSVDCGTSASVVSGRYAAGYRKCVVEVAHYLNDVASNGYSDGLIDAVRSKLMRHLTAILHTKVLHRPDDNEQLRPAMTSLSPKPEVKSESCNSTDGSCAAGDGRTVSRASSARSETEAHEFDVSAVSPSFLEPVDPALGQFSASLAPSCQDRAMVGRLAAASPSSANRDEASSASAACRDLLTARSVDGCVWRPW